MERFGLTLHPEKTRLLDFRRPPRSRGEGRSPTTFDFLGFCWYYRRTRKGNWTVACKTRRARLARAIQRVYAWCRENRHLPVKEQHAKLVRRVQGHINYFGVNGNMASPQRFVQQVIRSWYKWLNRRSQRARLNWERFEDLLEALPLQADAGTPVADVCRQLGVSEASFYHWRKKYGELGVSGMREVRQLREENTRLKRLVADLTLDKHILGEVLRKSLKPARRRMLACWIIEQFRISTLRACRLARFSRSAYYRGQHEAGSLGTAAAYPGHRARPFSFRLSTDHGSAAA